MSLPTTPTRPAIDWRAPTFLDNAAFTGERRRVFEVCHTCRRCGDLCESFPRLFDLIDTAADGSLAAVPDAALDTVADACTLCDLCYPVCPYVPPHVHAVDFPHLMVRQRALEKHRGARGAIETALGETDRNGRLMGALAALTNWATDRRNGLTRPLIEWLAGVHRDAVLPRFHARTFSRRAKAEPAPLNRDAPAAGRKAVLYGTCFVEYNNPAIGLAARAVLAKNGVETAVVYPTCCGMPQLERGDVAGVCERARTTAAALVPWIERGYDIIAPIPSCALMMKTTWPLHLPDDAAVNTLSANTYDISEYVVDIARTEGLADGLTPLAGSVALHLACHARAQNIGAKSAVMLRMIPEADVLVMKHCSGHGGTWGVMKQNYEIGMKVGTPVIRQAAESGRAFLASECPLAGDHIVQGMERLAGDGHATARESHHPIELLAMSYGLR